MDKPSKPRDGDRAVASAGAALRSAWRFLQRAVRAAKSLALPLRVALPTLAFLGLAGAVVAFLRTDWRNGALILLGLLAALFFAAGVAGQRELDRFQLPVLSVLGVDAIPMPRGQLGQLVRVVVRVDGSPLQVKATLEAIEGEPDHDVTTPLRWKGSRMGVFTPGERQLVYPLIYSPTRPRRDRETEFQVRPLDWDNKPHEAILPLPSSDFVKVVVGLRPVTGEAGLLVGLTVREGANPVIRWEVLGPTR